MRESDQAPNLGLMVKVAAGVSFGHLRQPGLKFAYQLTGLPAAWRVGSVHFTPVAGVLSGQLLYLAGTGGSDGPEVDVAPARPGDPCHIFYPHGQRRVINGSRVVVNHIPAAGSSPASFQVCAAHADGLFVLIDFRPAAAPGGQHLPPRPAAAGPRPRPLDYQAPWAERFGGRRR